MASLYFAPWRYCDHELPSFEPLVNTAHLTEKMKERSMAGTAYQWPEVPDRCRAQGKQTRRQSYGYAPYETSAAGFGLCHGHGVERVSSGNL
jgi:hypothetical protein